MAFQLFTNNQEKELFLKGENYESYKYFGAFLDPKVKDTVLFRVFAKNAEYVSVIGEFNGWDIDASPMICTGEGVYELNVSGACRFDSYKYFIRTKDNQQIFKSDPFGVHCQTRPGNSSKVYNINGFKWNDEAFIKNRKREPSITQPLNIYELHLSSWKIHPSGNFYSYREIADSLIPYIKEMGYTHIELLPVCEHPYDQSFGYQVTGYYAPTSRFGTPHDLMYFVNSCHKADIGVILDWVPAHFPKDDYGLYKFDGSYLYEDKNPHNRENKEWGTVSFDYSEGFVQSFLISNAIYWLKEYHFDGLRVGAVSSMLYLDYKKSEQEWQKNQFGTNINLFAVDFLQKLNLQVSKICKNALMIAELERDFKGVTIPVSKGGLGFTYKWHLPWAEAILSYMSTDPFFRVGRHSQLTSFADDRLAENTILPISHDDVVNGKCSLINKMPGEYDDKFAELRTFYGYMIAHPGKKLMFMGQEFGQFIEWNCTKELNWMLLDFDKHRMLREFVKELNMFYKMNNILWENEAHLSSFKWLVHDDAEQNIVAFLRQNKAGKQLVVVSNFAPVDRDGYRIGLSEEAYLKEVFNSNELHFGGGSNKNESSIRTKKISMHGRENSVELFIPALTTMYLSVKPIGINKQQKE